MPKITRIKLQKSLSGRQKRANIFVDGKFLLGLPIEVVAKEDLRVGKEICGKEIEDLAFGNEYHRFLDAVYNLLSHRPRSKAEIEKYLHGKHASEKASQKILKKLEAENYINDEAFARWWLGQRQTFRQKGKLALKAELRQKGVEEEVIRQVLEEEVDEVKLATLAVQKKMAVLKKLPARDFHQKVFGFLARKGFSFETIKTVLDEIEKKR